MSQDNVALLEIIPAQSNAVLAVDIMALSNQSGNGQLGSLLNPANDADPLLQKLALVIEQATMGLDPAKDFDNFLAAYHLTTEPEVTVLANVGNKSVSDLFPGESENTIGDYRGVELLLFDDSRRVAASLPGGALCLGSESTVRAVIDHIRDKLAANDSSLVRALSGEIEKYPIAYALDLNPETENSPVAPTRLTIENSHLLAGGFTLDASTLQGVARFTLPGAPAFLSKFIDQLENGEATMLSAPDEETLEIALSLDIDRHFNRFLLKQLSHGMEAVDYAQGTGVGADLPWLTFNVSDKPESIFINYTFADERQRAAFEQEVLPAGFGLAPLTIVAGETPAYYLVLNIYGSSGGLVEGARAEWSVFVTDPTSGKPRFLVIEAVAASLAADPVNLLTPPEIVSHDLDQGEIRSQVIRKNEDGDEFVYYQSAFVRPEVNEGGKSVLLSSAFAAANDYIFWGNGVADRGVYNGSVYAKAVTLIDPISFEYDDNSRWWPYLSEAPRHVFSYRNALEIVISPWFNLEASYLDVTGSHRNALIEFSNNFYPMIAQGQALAAFNGKGDLTQPRMEAAETPSVYYHFDVLDPQGLEASLPEAGHKLAAIALKEGGSAGFYLSLQVSEAEGDACGLAADWITYVENPATGLPKTLYLARQSNKACVDADLLFRPPASINVERQGSRYYIVADTLVSQFSASVDPGLGSEVIPAAGWVATLDDQCSLGGYCDRSFYDGDSLIAPLREIDTSAIDVSNMTTPWDSFITVQPAAVILRDKPRLLVTLPWTNIKPLAAQASKTGDGA